MIPPWLDTVRKSTQEEPSELPRQVDVAIVGGGLAGVCIALFLAEAGTDVAIFETRDSVGHGGSGRQPGLVCSGLSVHPHRLVHAMGLSSAQTIYQLSRESRSLLTSLLTWTPAGAAWTAIDAREVEWLEESARVLEDLGEPVDLWQADQAQSRCRGNMTGASLFFPEEGAINGAQATQALAERATRAGAQLLTGRSVVRVQSEGPDHQVHLTDGVVRCHAVVFAANAQLGAIDPYFEDKIQSVREHAQAGVGSAETLPTPGRTQQGYARWNFHGPEHWVLAGCRWATPHLEVMETDDTVTLPIVQTKLDEFRQRIFPHLSANAPSHRWSYLIAHTCDGLPIVGPIPGSPSLVCCAGFQGQQWGLAPRLARAVADGLLTSRAPGIPDFFTPARFV